jgi:hypothetical protein
MGTGALAAGVISIGKQYFVEGKSLRETLNIHTLNFAIKGAIAAGGMSVAGVLLPKIGILSVQGVTSAAIGGGFNVGVGYGTAEPGEYTDRRFFTDFAIGAFWGATAHRVGQVPGVWKRTGLLGLTNVGENLTVHAVYGNYDKVVDPTMWSVAFAFGLGGAALGELAGKAVQNVLSKKITDLTRKITTVERRISELQSRQLANIAQLRRYNAGIEFLEKRWRSPSIPQPKADWADFALIPYMQRKLRQGANTRFDSLPGIQNQLASERIVLQGLQTSLASQLHTTQTRVFLATTTLGDAEVYPSLLCYGTGLPLFCD